MVENQTTAELKTHTVQEVAKILHCSTKTILTRIKERKLKAARIGGKLLISTRDLNAYYDANRLHMYTLPVELCELDDAELLEVTISADDLYLLG